MKINPEKIMEGMIKKGFPDLYKESITLKYYMKRKNCFMDYSLYSDKSYSIGISEIMKNCSVAVFKGGLGHELSHIARERTETKTQDRLYKKYKEYRLLEERDTDLETIIRGYGKELLKFVEFTDKIKAYTKEAGLSAREVRNLLKK